MCFGQPFEILLRPTTVFIGGSFISWNIFDRLDDMTGMVLRGCDLQYKRVKVKILEGHAVFHGASHYLGSNGSISPPASAGSPPFPTVSPMTCAVIFCAEFEDGEPLGVIGGGIDQWPAPLIVMDLKSGLYGLRSLLCQGIQAKAQPPESS